MFLNLFDTGEVYEGVQKYQLKLANCVIIFENNDFKPLSKLHNKYFQWH